MVVTVLLELPFDELPFYRFAFQRIFVAGFGIVIPDWLATDQTTDTPPNSDDQSGRRLRYVFDEGHHLFDAADSATAKSANRRNMSTGARSWRTVRSSIADAAIEKLPTRKVLRATRSMSTSPTTAPRRSEAL